MSSAFIHETAEVSSEASIGPGSSVWHLVQVREHVTVGANCVLGRACYVGPGVTIGDATKIQNLAMIYDPAVIGRGVFIGPAVVLTNDVYPRAVDPDLRPKQASDWEASGVRIDDGASVGARSVILAGVHVGEWALIAAGSVVIRDVPSYALVAGNPAVRKGWVGRTGRRLVPGEHDTHLCPETGDTFRETDGVLVRLTV